ncbi:MAG: acyltransferase family protein [Actinomycetia bacterium]|nr:acyltransferase family protein [Actinomycetes bacterium]
MTAAQTPATAGASAPRRRYDLDALRGFAMLLGVGLHAALAFIPVPWWVQDRTSSFDGLYDEFLWAVHGFRMPLFFLMSGFFTALLWRRRGLRTLLEHRLRRVALPLAIGLVTLVPAVDWVGERAIATQAEASVDQGDIFALVFTGSVEGVEQLLDQGLDVDTRTEPGGWTPLHAAAFTGDADMVKLLISRGAEPAPVASASEGETPLALAFHFGHEEATDLLVAYEGQDPLPERVKWSDIPGFGAGADESGEDRLTQIEHLHHLWFLWFLLWLVAGFAVVAAFADRFGADSGVWPKRLMWLMVPLTIVPQLSMGRGGTYPVFGSDTSDALLPLPHVLLYYATFFTFGALMYGRKHRDDRLVVDTIGRPWWLILGVSFFLVLPVGLHFTFVDLQWPVASALQVLYAWGMCFGLMGLFRVVLSGERRGVRYLSDSAYWVYLIHLPLVVAAQIMVRDLNLAAGVKFLMICVGVTAVSLLSYQAFVRYTPIGTMLNGKKARAGQVGRR